jgi:hypothetical protein
MRYAAIVLFLLVLVAGCRAAGAKLTTNPGAVKSGQFQVVRQQPPISSPATFLWFYRQWTDRLTGLAGEVNDSYSKWSNHQINRQEFLDQLYAVQEKLEGLKLDADYSDVELNQKDQQSINSEAITKAYLMAEKGVNDFLYYAPHLNDEQIKAKYNDLILNEYNTGNQELKMLLNPS